MRNSERNHLKKAYGLTTEQVDNIERKRPKTQTERDSLAWRELGKESKS